MKEKWILYKVKKKQKEAINKGVYSLFNSKFAKEKTFSKSATIDGMEYFSDLFEEWDKVGGVVPQELGEYVESLLYSDVRLGIHRSPLLSFPDYSETLQDVFKIGLYNNGDVSSGMYNARPEPDKTISFFDNMLNFMIMLKSSYKGSTGSLLVGIPKELFNDDGTMKKARFYDIYDIVNNIPTIKKEYILGYLCATNGKFALHTKEEVLKNEKNTNFG